LDGVRKEEGGGVVTIYQNQNQISKSKINQQQIKPHLETSGEEEGRMGEKGDLDSLP